MDELNTAFDELVFILADLCDYVLVQTAVAVNQEEGGFFLYIRVPVLSGYLPDLFYPSHAFRVC